MHSGLSLLTRFTARPTGIDSNKSESHAEIMAISRAWARLPADATSSWLPGE